jgi:putative ABC transport system substrate-binding protein
MLKHQTRSGFVVALVATCVLHLGAASVERKIPLIGFLSPADGPGANHRAFLRELATKGYVEGQTVSLEWRWAHQQYGKLPDLASELVSLNPNVIIAQTSAAAFAAEKATSSIPIVFLGVRDPVATGLLPNLNHPGGNITGVTFTPSPELAAKQIELLKEIVPTANRFGVLWNTSIAIQADVVKIMKEVAKRLEVDLESFGVRQESDLEPAFERMEHAHIAGLATLVESLTLQQAPRIARLAIDRHIATIFEVRDYVDAGGLLCYGVPYHEHYAEAADYAARVLKGERPGDMPVAQPARFDVVINMRTARMLGLEFPPSITVRATDVIE